MQEYLTTTNKRDVRASKKRLELCVKCSSSKRSEGSMTEFIMDEKLETG